MSISASKKSNVPVKPPRLNFPVSVAPPQALPQIRLFRDTPTKDFRRHNFCAAFRFFFVTQRKNSKRGQESGNDAAK